MSVTWTKEQTEVIEMKNRNLLVSAAAGSGKTAVLVEHIIHRITDPREPVDIDRLLVVTFTKAAAAEMRERVSDAVDALREKQEDNVNLERQLSLIHNAQITTIDSFCLFVVRNHFQEIGLDPNFRVADTGEIKLLEQDVLTALFEANYEKEENEAFFRLIDTYSGRKNDRAVKDMVMQIYRLAQSNPWPVEWMRELAVPYQIREDTDLLGQAVLKKIAAYAKAMLSDAAEKMAALCELALAEDGPAKYYETLLADKESLNAAKAIESYEDAADFLSGLSFANLPAIRNFTGDEGKKDRVQKERKAVKALVDDLKKKFFSISLSDMASQLMRMRPYVEELISLSVEYEEALAEAKREKHIVDFNDIEHFALNILVDENTKERRPAAYEFQKQFEEIMIDEYQDSNQVQEEILRAVSRIGCGGYNMMMVGDVKQSIYRFRLARPELFMHKYATYRMKRTVPDEPDRSVSGEKQGGSTIEMPNARTTPETEQIEDIQEQRIDLHKNFRSRKQVVDSVNDIFYKIMGKDLGNVSYDKDSALYCGAAYPDASGMNTEVLIFDGAGESAPEGGSLRQLEARMTAERIRSLVGTQLVTDKKTGELRPARYSDIVILFRSLKGWGNEFAQILEACGIPAHVESQTGYFSSTEVQTVLAMLEILDNPFQDIPMAAVLKSQMAGLDEEELAELRVNDREHSFAEAAYNQMKEAKEGKLFDFYQTYEKLRALVADTPIHELIRELLEQTGYGDYAALLPAGKKRAANLSMLLEKAAAYEKTSYKGLFHFVRYIEKLQKYDVDFGEADGAGELENAVSIMTIHKSKGLEFPIVFISGIAKQFNQTDMRQTMVLHPELGLGMYEKSLEPRIKRNCFLRDEIVNELASENIGEELRVLYVALTRAKEKLILTGAVSNWEKTLAAYTGEAREGKLLGYGVRSSAKSYLDWLIPALMSYPGKYEITVSMAEDLLFFAAKEAAEETLTKEAFYKQMKEADEELMRSLTGAFSYEYPYQSEAGKKSKYSVSEFKHASMVQRYDASEAETPDFLVAEQESYIPSFMRDGEEAFSDGAPSKGALRGTAVHRVMECFDFKRLLMIDRKDKAAVQMFVKEELSRMQEQEKITEEMAALVIPSVIEQFVESPTAERMAKADKDGNLFREKPFVMDYDGVLLQGIIDVFWLEEDRVVLLDYKTDAVKKKEELTARYETQLKLYADALGRIFDTKKKGMQEECLIYSFRLQEVITI